MDNLKDYIRLNNTSSTDACLPEGDAERFERRYDAYRHRIKFRTNVRRRGKPFWVTILLPAAASLLLVFIVRLAVNPVAEKFASADESRDSISMAYREYYGKVALLACQISDLTAYMDYDDAVAVMETMDDILGNPDEFMDNPYLSERRKLEMFEEYSRREISALVRFKDRITETSDKK